MSVMIRSYKVCDRQAVRKICCDTVDRGKPLENFFRDRELIADLVTAYYTDYEPNSLWIAECRGQVVGYLTGCLDNAKYNRVMAWHITPRAVLGAILRGVLFQHETWLLIKMVFKTWEAGGHSKKIPVDKYPVHMHIDIAEEFRGQHVGKGLMERFVEQVKNAGLGGIYAVVREDNALSCRFFEKMGFVALSHHPMFYLDHGVCERTRTIVYGKQV